ncbi:hypothetical protein BJV74DRAFT_207357 [Russula compacta]|nr:hypothetical protein BJV74DRAFT_207357 [Russula compacta]
MRCLVSLRKRKASRKPEKPEAGIDDDIDKTIAAFLTKRLQADPSAFSGLVTASGLAVPVNDPPPNTKWKGHRVKPGARTNGTTHTTAQVPPASSVEVMETNSTEGSIVREVNQRTQKLSRPPAPRGAVVAVAAVKETAASSQDSISERRFTSAEPLGSESGSKLGSAQQGFSPACLENSVYPLADCLAVQEGPDPIEARVTQMKKNPGFAPTSEAIAALRQFAEKARSTPSDLSSDSSDTESSKLSIPAPTSAALSRGG